MEPLDFNQHTLESAKVISTGYRDLDQILGGLLPGCLYTITGRPSMGKSCFMRNMMIKQLVNLDHSVAVVNLESIRSLFAMELLYILAGVYRRHMINGEITDEEAARLYEAGSILAEKDLFVIENEGSDIDSIIDEIGGGIVGQSCNVDVIYVDNLQLLHSKNHQYGSYARADEYICILEKLKHLALSLNMPVVLLSEANRGIRKQNSSMLRRPQLSDLGDYGAISEISDAVIAVYRPEMDCWSGFDSEGKDQRGIMEVAVLKNRHGAIGDCDFRFSHSTGRVEEIHPLFPTDLI